jgi:predicted transcriptional regulator
MKSKPEQDQGANSSTKVLATKAPAALIRKLDASAKKGGRTRSAEMRMRIEHSLKLQAVL